MKKQFIKAMVFVVFFSFTVVCEAADYKTKREEMVNQQIIARGVKDPNVIEAMLKIERHLFVPFIFRHLAYRDGPLSIGHNQTISQPYIVAYMSEVLKLKPDDKVLEIGTGSGYQAAVLAEIVHQVYTIEIRKPLADEARTRLENLGYENIFVMHGDGYMGWPEYAPFDKIIVTAAPDQIPMKLIDQLKIGGKMVVPIGSFYQELYLIIKTEDGFDKKPLLPVRFVPMIKGKE